MNKWIARADASCAEEDGPTAVEYAVMLALIIVVCITAITALGSNANNTFSYVGTRPSARLVIDRLSVKDAVSGRCPASPSNPQSIRGFFARKREAPCVSSVNTWSTS